MFDRYNDDCERLAWVLLRGRASLVTDAGEKASGAAAQVPTVPDEGAGGAAADPVGAGEGG